MTALSKLLYTKNCTRNSFFSLEKVHFLFLRYGYTSHPSKPIYIIIGFIRKYRVWFIQYIYYYFIHFTLWVELVI